VGSTPIHSEGSGLIVRNAWRINRAPVFVVALVLSIAVLSGCSRTAPPPTVAVSVTAGRSESRNMPIQVESVGNVGAYNSAVVMAQVTGRVLRLHFREGQDVKAGDLLITIDPGPFEQKVSQARAQLAHDSEQAAFAAASAKRYDALFKQGAISRQDYEQANANSSALAATSQQAQAAVENARLDLANCYVRAPIDGRTGAFLANQGALATANLTQLVVVNQIEPALIKFTVPEKSLAAILAAQGKGPLKAVANIAEQGLRVEDGLLTFIDNTVDTSTGMVQMKAQFPNLKRELWPGQFVRITLVLGNQFDAVVVPAEAVNMGQAGRYVFVVKEDMSVESRTVEQDRVIGNLAVISKGLSAGETVVTDGQVNLRTGAKVSIKGDNAKQGSAAPNRQGGETR